MSCRRWKSGGWRCRAKWKGSRGEQSIGLNAQTPSVDSRGIAPTKPSNRVILHNKLELMLDLTNAFKVEHSVKFHHVMVKPLLTKD